MGAFKIFRKFSQLLDRETVDLPAINTPLAEALDAKAASADLADVATSGAYADLSGTPAVPTAVAELTDATTYDFPTLNTPVSDALAGKSATSHTHTNAEVNTSIAASPSATRTVLGLGENEKVCATRSNPLNIASFNPGSAVSSRTFRSSHVAPRGLRDMRLVFGNHYYSSGAGNSETPNPARITVKAAIEYPIAPISSSTAADTIFPIYFNGFRTISIPGGAIVYSDIVLHPDIPPGASFAVRTWVNMPDYATDSAPKFIPTGWVADAAILEGVSNAGDVVDGGAIGAGSSSTTLYGPSKIIGLSDTDGPSALVIGDSIAVGTSELTTRSESGFILRALDSGVPYVFGARAGEALVSGFSAAKRFRRVSLSRDCFSVISNYGTNDLAAIATGEYTLEDLKAAIVSVTNLFTKHGKKVFWCSVLPKTTSSDLWTTAAGQTITSQEANRVDLNTWLRDGSYMNECDAPSLVSIFDPAELIEVNESNILTLNGGRWIVPDSADFTGTATGGTTTTMTDSGKSWTPGEFVGGGYYLRTLGGVGSGQNLLITGNTATSVTFATATATGAGTTYEIIRPYTADGVHPTQRGHVAASVAIDTGILQ